MASKKLRKPSASVLFDEQIRIYQNELAALDADIKTRIRQLAVECADGTATKLHQFAHGIHERLTQFDSKLTDFEQFVRQTKSKSKAAKKEDEDELSKYTAKIDRYRMESQANLQNFRRAKNAASQEIEKRERAALLFQNSDGSSNVRQRQAGGDLAGQSSELTEGLTSLVRQMDAQVRQSETTLTALINSSQTLTETETEFKDMGATIQSSGKLLSKYGRREMTDKLLIFLALLFYFGCVFYIIRKRFFGHFF